MSSSVEIIHHSFAVKAGRRQPSPNTSEYFKHLSQRMPGKARTGGIKRAAAKKLSPLVLPKNTLADPGAITHPPVPDEGHVSETPTTPGTFLHRSLDVFMGAVRGRQDKTEDGTVGNVADFVNPPAPEGYIPPAEPLEFIDLTTVQTPERGNLNYLQTPPEPSPEVSPFVPESQDTPTLADVLEEEEAARAAQALNATDVIDLTQESPQVIDLTQDSPQPIIIQPLVEGASPVTPAVLPCLPTTHQVWHVRVAAIDLFIWSLAASCYH